MTAKRILAEHNMRIDMAQEETASTRHTVAILFRSMLQSFGFANEFSADDTGSLGGAVNVLSDKMTFNIAHQMASESIRMSKGVDLSTIGNSSSSGFRFVGGLLLVWSRSDSSVERLGRLALTTPNKWDRLFRIYYEALTELFNGHEELLFTDKLDRQAQRLGM